MNKGTEWLSVLVAVMEFEGAEVANHLQPWLRSPTETPSL